MDIQKSVFDTEGRGFAYKERVLEKLLGGVRTTQHLPPLIVKAITLVLMVLTLKLLLE